LATDDNSEDLKFVRITSQSTGIIVLEMCLLLGWQTVAECIVRNTVHTLFNTLKNILCQTTIYCATFQYYA
jgi:hypothetical protein